MTVQSKGVIPEIKLKVVEAVQEEDKGIVRINTETMKEIDVKPGDIVEIEGERKTAGIVDKAYPLNVGESIISMDGILRKNAKTSISKMVKVRKADVKEAKAIIIAPAQEGIMVQANPELFKRGWLGRVVMKGDLVALGGTTRRKKTTMESPFFDDVFDLFEDGELLTNVGFGRLNFIVENTVPNGIVLITEETEIKFTNKKTEIPKNKIIEVVKLPDMKNCIKVKSLKDIIKLAEAGNFINKFETKGKIIYFLHPYYFEEIK